MDRPSLMNFYNIDAQNQATHSTPSAPSAHGQYGHAKAAEQNDEYAENDFSDDDFDDDEADPTTYNNNNNNKSNHNLSQPSKHHGHDDPQPHHSHHSALVGSESAVTRQVYIETIIQKLRNRMGMCRKTILGLQNILADDSKLELLQSRVTVSPRHPSSSSSGLDPSPSPHKPQKPQKTYTPVILPLTGRGGSQGTGGAYRPNRHKDLGRSLVGRTTDEAKVVVSREGNIKILPNVRQPVALSSHAAFFQHVKSRVINERTLYNGPEGAQLQRYSSTVRLGRQNRAPIRLPRSNSTDRLKRLAEAERHETEAAVLKHRKVKLGHHLAPGVYGRSNTRKKGQGASTTRLFSSPQTKQPPPTQLRPNGRMASRRTYSKTARPVARDLDRDRGARARDIPSRPIPLSRQPERYMYDTDPEEKTEALKTDYLDWGFGTATPTDDTAVNQDTSNMNQGIDHENKTTDVFNNQHLTTDKHSMDQEETTKFNHEDMAYKQTDSDFDFDD